MKKIIIGIIILLVFLVSGFVFYLFLQSRSPMTTDCYTGYMEVSKFNQKINSEEDAKKVALDYYSSIEYDFNLEDLNAIKNDEGDWLIRLNESRISLDVLISIISGIESCIYCDASNLKLEEKLFSRNKILMIYSIPC